MKGTTARSPAVPENVKFEVKDGVLAIGIDTTKRIGTSKSGKSELIGTTHGIIKTPEGFSFSVTAFAPKAA
jgi:hypothetical protein